MASQWEVLRGMGSEQLLRASSRDRGGEGNLGSGIPQRSDPTGIRLSLSLATKTSCPSWSAPAELWWMLMCPNRISNFRLVPRHQHGVGFHSPRNRCTLYLVVPYHTLHRYTHAQPSPHGMEHECSLPGTQNRKSPSPRGLRT